MDEALIICEHGKLRIGELQQEMGKTEAEYRRTCTEFFKPIKGTWHEITPPEEKSPYEKLLQGFADECEGTAPGSSSGGFSGMFSGGFAAPDGREGRKSLLISNAIYLSSWEKKMIELPKIDSEEELQFEKAFESALSKKCGTKV